MAKSIIPKGYNGNGTPNPHIQYGFGSNGVPYLQIITNRFDNAVSEGYIIINVGNLTSTGNYNYPEFNFSIGWAKVLGECFTPILDLIIQKSGSVNITKLDITNRIISGTFNCKFKTASCDTISITDGRFDVKF